MPFLAAGGRETYTDANLLHIATGNSNLDVSSDAKAFLIIESGVTVTSFKKGGQILIAVPSSSASGVVSQIVTLSGASVDNFDFIVAGGGSVKVFELF